MTQNTETQADNLIKDSMDNSVKPRFDFSSAKAVKQVPQLSTNRSARYTRPETDAERGQAFSDLYDSEHGKKLNPLEQGVKAIDRAVNSPETTTAISAILGGGTEAFGGWSPMAVSAMRGIEAGKEKPASTGNPIQDGLNSIYDNAMRGVFEPESVEPTSVHILKSGLAGNSYSQAAVAGTLAEFYVSMVTNPLAIIPDGFQALSRETQNTLLFNKITQSTEYGDNVMALAGETGQPWQKIHNDSRIDLWNSIHKNNYFQVALANIELYKPFTLKGLTIENFEGMPKDPSELMPMVWDNNGNFATGANHEEALNKLGLSKDTHTEDKDFTAGFMTPKGGFLTREETGKQYKDKDGKPITHSEQLPPKKTKAVQVAPDDAPEKITPEKIVKMRINKLESDAKSIDEQMTFLEGERERLNKAGLSTENIDAKLKGLGQKWQLYDSQIAEHIIGQNRKNELINQVVQGKVKDIDALTDEAEESGYGQGFRKGIVLGKNQGEIKEARRQAENRLIQRYKKYGKAEVKKIANRLNNLKTEGLPLEFKQEIDNLMKGYDFNKRIGRTLANRESTRKFLEAMKERGEGVNVPQDVIDMAYATPLNEMTLQQLREVDDMIMGLYRQGKLFNKLQEAQGLRDLEDVAKQVVANITKGEGLKPVTNLMKHLEDIDRGFVKDKVKNGLEWAKNYIVSNMNPELLVNFLDGVDHTGVATRSLWNPVHESANEEAERKDQAYKAMDEIFGHRKPKDWQIVVQVGDKKFTLGNMMKIYACAANDASRADLIAFGLKDEDIDNVEKALPEEDKMAVKKLWQYFDNGFNEQYKLRYELEGVETKKEDNYFPIFNQESVSPTEDLEWERQYRRDIRRGSVDKGMLKERTGIKKAYQNLNFFGDINKSIERTAHYMAFAKTIKNANKFLNHPDIQQSIRQKFGDHYYNVLVKWIKDCGMGKLKVDMGYPARIARGTRMMMTPAVLGINFVTAEKQFIGFLQGMQMAGKSATLTALPKFIKNLGKNVEAINKESRMMRYRGMHQEREYEELLSNRSLFEREGHLSFWPKFQQAIMWPVQASDLIVARAIYFGSKANSAALGIKGEDAIKEAERVVRRTQPMGGIYYLPDMFRGGELEKQMTWVKGHRNKLFNLQLEMLAKKGLFPNTPVKDKSSNSQFIHSLLFFSILPMYALANIEKKKLDSIKNLVSALGSQFFTGVYGLQELFEALENPKALEGAEGPLVQYIAMWTKVFTGKSPETRKKAFIRAAATTAKLPVTGGERIFKGEEFGHEDKYQQDFGGGQTGGTDLMKN